MSAVSAVVSCNVHCQLLALPHIFAVVQQGHALSGKCIESTVGQHSSDVLRCGTAQQVVLNLSLALPNAQV